MKASLRDLKGQLVVDGQRLRELEELAVEAFGTLDLAARSVAKVAPVVR